jgi:hypothetical protein
VKNKNLTARFASYLASLTDAQLRKVDKSANHSYSARAEFLRKKFGHLLVPTVQTRRTN